MTTPTLSPHEIIERGKALYEQSIRDRLSADQHGKVLVIDVESGDYEVDADQLAADDRLRLRHPDAVFFGMRIGYPTLSRLGGSLRTKRP